MPQPNDHSGGPLLTLRAAVIFLISLIVGTAAAALTYWTGHSGPAAALAGGGACGGAIALFNGIIG